MSVTCETERAAKSPSNHFEHSATNNLLVIDIPITVRTQQKYSTFRHSFWGFQNEACLFWIS